MSRHLVAVHGGCGWCQKFHTEQHDNDELAFCTSEDGGTINGSVLQKCPDSVLERLAGFPTTFARAGSKCVGEACEMVGYRPRAYVRSLLQKWNA